MLSDMHTQLIKLSIAHANTIWIEDSLYNIDRRGLLVLPIVASKTSVARPIG